MTSSVPTVVAALGALTAGLGSGPAYVGEPPQGQTGDFIAVCWAGPDNPAVVAQQPRAGVARQMENYDVAIQLVAWQGDTNLLDCINRVYATHDLLVAAVLADKSLGGACMDAAVASSELRPDMTGKGAIATLTVTVSVSNFLR